MNFPAPVLLGYPRETVIAEKLQALTVLGILNSRLKDYFDIWLLSRLYSFEGPLLAEAIRATFENRSTVDPDPTGLTEIYSSDLARLRQWSAFRRRARLSTAPEDLSDLVQLVRDFAAPVLSAIAGSVDFKSNWKPGGPWSDSR